MKTLKKILDYKKLILPASIISAVILSLSIISPAIANVRQGIDTHTSCVNTVFPDNTERDIVVDPDAGLMYVGYEENGVQKNVTLSIKDDSRFYECTDGVQELVSLARKNNDKMNSDTCIELKDIASSAKPIPMLDDGKKMDITDVNNYISKHCQ